MRRLLLTVVTVGVAAVTVVALGTAARSGPTSARFAPSAEVAWPWEPEGSIPAGTAGNNWEHGKADLADSQFSYWKQINTSNVGSLKVAWTQNLSLPTYTGGIQGTPIVVSGKNKNIPIESGTMYVAANWGVVALNPSSGEILWKYQGPPPKPNQPGGSAGAQLQYGNTTKYFTYCNGAITTGQQDGSIAAINAKTGAPLWTNQVSAVSEFAGHTGQTSPPTDCLPNGGPNHAGLVFGGPNGSSSPLRGHMDAIDLKTGKLVWRWFTTPDPTQLPFILTWGNPAEAALGGGGTWSSVSIDPGLHTLFSATGNAYAQLGRQPGKNLWTASSFALNTDTGALRWYWQEAHHDNWDLDHGGDSALANVKINDKWYPAFFTCNKVGNCEMLDRRNGSPLPNFPMKEVAVDDDSGGAGLKLNSEWPTQPEVACLPFNSASLSHFSDGDPLKGSKCATANLLLHCPNDADAKMGFATWPVGSDGKPMVARCSMAATFWDKWYTTPTCSCGLNYNRLSYSPLTNDFYTCANNTFTARHNVSPSSWQWTTTSSPIIQVWISAFDASTNTMDFQKRLWGATIQNGVVTGGDNPGFAKGTWSQGCYGGAFTTAGNLLFQNSWSDNSRGSTTNFTDANAPWGGTLAAWNATTGEGPLWTWQAPAQMNGSPMTYAINGKQYVAVYHRMPVQGSAQYSGFGERLTVFSL